MFDDEQVCKECGKKFTVEIMGDTYPGGKEREEIWCPHCGALNGHIMTSGIVRTQKHR